MCRPWVSFPRPWARRLPESPLETTAWDENDGAHMGVVQKIPKMDDLQWKIVLKWKIRGYP